MNEDVVLARVTYARLALGLNRREFADLTGVGRRTMGYWECGERAPNLKSLRKIANATGRPVGWFIGLDEEQAA